MKTLEKDWLTTGLIDYEYKKYVLLAYLQAVKNNFELKKLYPDLSDLEHHYEYSLYFKSGLRQMMDNFPKRISGVNTEDLSFNYELAQPSDIGYFNEIESITEFALNRFRYGIKLGRDIAREVEHQVSISPIGIEPLYKNEGYFFLYEPWLNESRIYQFNLTIFEDNHEKMRGLKIFYVDTVKRSMVNTFENIKLDLIKRFKHLPNPATYMIEAPCALPLEETLLPIAKKKIVSFVSSAA
ncbi:MAG: hypothetical protein ACOVOW_10110 [Spirosomataceae bacterium]|jgi:hypothetical protein